MVDGVLLLVDASEGPLPQTRFVLRKALEARLPIILVINKVDRPDARIKEVVDETYELFLDLDADEHQIDFPIVYACARDGGASLNQPEDGAMPRLRRPGAAVPDDPRHDPGTVLRGGAPLQAHVTNLDASPFLGRLALCRVHDGHHPQGPDGRVVPRPTARIERVTISELLMTEALERKPADEAGPGDIIAVAGIPEIMIGETLADAGRTRARCR